MLGDDFTKYLSGSLFRKFGAIIIEDTGIMEVLPYKHLLEESIGVFKNVSECSDRLLNVCTAFYILCFEIK